MAISLADQYYLKAIDDYPYNLEDAVESLNYALGYEEDHAGANYLMGKLQMEHFERFELAEEYFIMAMASDPCSIKTCESYAWLMLRTRRFDETLKLLQYAYGLKGANLPKLLRVEALVYESKKDYAKAKALLLKAIEESYDAALTDFLEMECERVDKKARMQRGVNYEIN